MLFLWNISAPAIETAWIFLQLLRLIKLYLNMVLTQNRQNLIFATTQKKKMEDIIRRAQIKL